MINENEIKEKILSNLPFAPSLEQLALVKGLSSFIAKHAHNDVFVLNGYAGTGKTSVMGALFKTMKSFEKKTVVLAPTGRAAKVTADFSLGLASTIHKRLYRGNSADPSNASYFLTPNTDSDTLFIVDEASLITDGTSLSSSLLLQLIRHIYSSPGCYLILVGDLAQLPPVGQSRSSAMDEERLLQIGLNPIKFSLVTPLRQASESGILYNATNIRNLLFSNSEISRFKIFKSGFPDVEIIESTEMLDYLASSWKKVGKNDTIVITRSNYRANVINNSIRRYLLDADGPLIAGERLIISKNDYFWSKKNNLHTFLANGEIAIITNLGKKLKKYGRWFEEVELKIPGVDNLINAMLILRSLIAEGPSISREEMERFYNRVLAETEGELSEKIKTALESPFYNALQMKYGYCITCHKAQGGQWRHVYIDLGGLSQELPTNDFFRWLYTAVTRATEKIFFLNSPFPVV